MYQAEENKVKLRRYKEPMKLYHGRTVGIFIAILALLLLAGCITTTRSTPQTVPTEAPTTTDETIAEEEEAEAEEAEAEEAEEEVTSPTPSPLPTEAPETEEEPANGEEAQTEPLEANTLLLALEEQLNEIYTRVSPSVVNIRVVQRHPGVSHDMPDIPGLPPFPEEGEDFFVPGLGSGFVWDTEGHIVTNNHVVANADRISVTFADGIVAEGEVVGADPDSDLAVVKVDAEDIPAGQLYPVEVVDSSEVKVGQLAVAIGNPFGLEGTMTVGFVSALGRSLPVERVTMGGATYSIPDIIQTDASINPGNSGGVMVDDQGRLIGVPSAIQSPVRASVGVGFAIPSAIVQKVVPVLIEEGAYEHAWLGITGTTMIPDIAREMELDPNQHGALVLEVVTDGPADAGGVRGSDRQISIDGLDVRVGGDIIVGFDGRPVESFDDLVAYLARYTEAGQSVTLTVLRDGEEKELEVTLGSRPQSNQQNNQPPEEITQSNTWLGIEGQTLTTDVARAMDLPANQGGVLVVQVEQESPADEAKLRGSFKNLIVNGEMLLIGGDVIVAINERPISTLDDLTRTIRGFEPGEEITLTILRNNEELNVDVTLEERPDS
jgi:S1-C subfamily serine protease